MIEENQGLSGRVPSEPGSREPSPSVSAASGFDPSRIVPWPDNNQPLDFEQLHRPIIHAIRFAYDLQRRDKRKSIPWRGPEIGQQDRACCALIAERLQAKNLSYSEEDQGRDALHEIISAAIQLGIEQGRRVARSDAADLLDEFSGAIFTVSVGWDDWTHVNTKAGLRAAPVECLDKAIEALRHERDRVARCPRERFLRDSDGSPKGGDGEAGSVACDDSAGRQASPETQS